MRFTLRPYCLFPVHCAVTYNAGPFQGQGTISCTGWRLSGDLPMRPGEALSLTVRLPNEQHILIPEAIVRWSRGQDLAMENVAIEPHTHARLKHYVKRLVQSTDDNLSLERPMDETTTVDGPFNARPQRQTEEPPMTSLRTTVPNFLRTPKIHRPICSLSISALVLVTSTVRAEQNAVQGECSGYPKSQKEIQQRPKAALKELVEACAAIVREETNERLMSQATEFDAYVTADGSVANVGTDQEDLSFGNCMNEQGHPPGEWE